uniref:Chromosome condensation protein n=1 Tax=Colletotrichum fructicola (strain Nara gc5) TaxID=1213859 RepID=L2G8F8_COLFN
MENGNTRELTGAHDAERGPGQLYNVEEGEEVNPERRGTFGRPLLMGSTSDDDARDEDVDPSGSRAGKPSLEQIRSGERRTNDIEMQDGHATPNGSVETSPTLSEDKPVKKHVSKLATEIYTVSYLVFFAILGTLARLGLQALTTYPDAPVSFGVLWANWGTPTYDEQIRKARRERDAGGNAVRLIPLYIGLATGFCGSFTSFSSFIRDVFLAMSNDLPGAGGVSPVPRNGGYSFMAMMAVIISTVGLSLCGLFVGAHLGAALEPITPSIPYSLGRKVFDRVAVVLGWGCWIGAVLMSIWPPHDAWRGQTLFSLVFAPLGCLGRFYVSMLLNSRIPAFPLGTFAVNISGVAVLGMCWDLGHAELGGLVGCQVLQGIEDGFCGCLTTVSTWVAELSALRRRHAYIYGMTSVVAGFAIMVIIMGGMRWSDGFGPLICTH